jgi:hypothetical protein
MSDYARFFEAAPGTPLYERAHAILTERKSASVEVLAFTKSVGMTDVRGHGPASYQFIGDGGRGNDAWKKSPYGYVPRKNTAAGKALAAQVAKLPKCPSFHDAVEAVPGLYASFPVLIYGQNGQCNSMRHISKDRVICSVPWRDIEPSKLEAYKADESYSSCELDHLCWTPPEWLTEIPEWQALKYIADATEQKKAA